MINSLASQHVNSRHLQKEQFDRYTHQYNQHPASVISVDQFLLQERADKCAHFLHTHATYKNVYGLYSKSPNVPEQAWLNEPESKRFFTYQVLDGSKKNDTITTGGLNFLKLRQFLRSPDFKAYLENIVNQPLGEATEVNVHLMHHTHFLKKHDDRHGNRRIAFILYLSPSWKSDQGGELHLIDKSGKQHSIEPTFNRLLVFDVENHDYHYISKILGANSRRLSINGWFKNP